MKNKTLWIVITVVVILGLYFFGPWARPTGDLDTDFQEAEDGIERFNDYFLHLFADVQVDIENKMKGIDLGSVMQSLGIESKFKK